MTNPLPANSADTPATSTTASYITYTGAVPTDTSLTTHVTTAPSAHSATDAQRMTERLNSTCKECLRHVWAIRDALQTEMTPAQMADARMKLTGFYSTLTTVYNKANELNTQEWMKLRPEFQSDTRTSKAIEVSELGAIEKKVKNELKAIEKMISSLKQRIEIMQGEARNQY